MNICDGCNQLEGIPEYDAALWDIYHRISDGRSTWEALSFTQDYVEENIMDEEDHNSMIFAMERDMVRRGLCPTCSRPNLSGITEDMVMSNEDLKEMQVMWAMEASERRMGC